MLNPNSVRLLLPGFSLDRKGAVGRAQVCGCGVTVTVTGELFPRALGRRALGRKAVWGQGKKGQHLATEAPVHSLTSVAPSLDSRA